MDPSLPRPQCSSLLGEPSGWNLFICSGPDRRRRRSFQPVPSFLKALRGGPWSKRTSEQPSQALCGVLPSAARAEAPTSLLHILPSSLPEVWPFPTSQIHLGFCPLACASPLPGEAVSFHGAPPRNLLTPQEQLTTRSVSSAPQKALCMPSHAYSP